MVNHFGTSKVSRQELEKRVCAIWNLKPSSIIKELDLLKRSYLSTASYGHFGREGENFTWEKTNRINDLKSYTDPV